MPRPTIADWLESLQRDGVATIDPDMALDVERLLVTWATENVTLEDAAQALAARVATSAEQYRAVRQSFEEAFDEGTVRDGGLENNVEAAGGRQEDDGIGRDMRWWFGILGLGFVAFGAWCSTCPREPPPSEPGLDATTTSDSEASSTGASTTVLDESTTAASDESPPSSEGNDGISVVEVGPPREILVHGSPWSPAMTLGFGLVTALMIALGLRWLVARTVRDEQVAEGLAARKQAFDRDGTDPGDLYRFKVPPPLDPTTIDAAADHLGRPGHGYEGTRLDVPKTLDHTMRAGGQPRPRFQRATRQPPLVVLVDVEEWGPSGHAYPLAHATEWILDRWQRTGLRFERFDYVGSLPTEVRNPRSGRAIDLQMLARRHGGARLIVWSRLRRLRGEPLAAWLAALRPWKRRTWIDLDPRPAVPVTGDEDGRVAAALERMAEIERSGLARYPLTRQGLVAAARHVAADRGLPPTVTDELLLRPGDEAQRDRIERALSQWAVAACCVPDPTWAHLDVLRTLLPDVRRVIPEARGVWWLLRWLERRGFLVETASRARDRLALRDGAERQLLDRMQRITVEGQASTVEHWVTQRLVQQLHDGAAASSGVASKIAEEERRARLAYYQCVKDPMGGVEALCKLLGSTADSLVRELLERLGHRMDVNRSEDGGRARARVKSALDDRVDVGRVMVRRPQPWEVVTALGVMVGVATVVSRMESEVVIGVRLEPPVYEVVLPEQEAGAGETISSGVDPPRAPPMVELVPLDLPSGARPMRLVRIEAGTFWMGSPEEELEHQPDEQRHLVTLMQAFLLCETEVTQAQWTAVMGRNPHMEVYGHDDNLPAHNMTWTMAVDFLNALSRKHGFSECYSIAQGEWEQRCEGYRLPTEAEWEYVARAGTQRRYGFGGDESLDDYAWYHRNSGRVVHPVATRRANPWGLYDIHGNVWEWVWDWYAPDYGEAPRTNPLGPQSGSQHVLRGGSFEFDAFRLRSAYRFFDLEDNPGVGKSYGLRCARNFHPNRVDTQ